MKTLAVLSAVAAIAIAAPTLEEYGDSTKLTSRDITITKQREKKSTIEETLPETPVEHSEDHASLKFANKFGLGSSNVKSFSGFKRPIIVKKKIGYHVYRDSDEEQAQADSRESCKKQIKVKLCDDNNSADKMKNASVHHTHEDVSENEMKHSIDMAKEAVELFQRDLQKMDQEFQNNGETHTKIKANKELREDIEKARQVLEDIEKKFKKLDSDTMSTNGGITDTNLKMIEENEEKIAQWKETMGKHKDLEIARNLEDNFEGLGKNEELKDLKTSPKANEDEVISVVDKAPKMEIHSDSLKKEKSLNEGDHEENKRPTMLEKNVKENIDEKTMHSMSTHDKHTETITSHHHEHKNHEIAGTGMQENKERNNDDDFTSPQSEKKSMESKEKHTWDKLENIDMLKSSMDSPVPDITSHMQVKDEIELHNEHLQSKDENDHKSEESKLNVLASTTNPKMMRSEESDVKFDEISKTDKHKENENNSENDKQKSIVFKQSATIPDQVNMLNGKSKQIDSQRSLEKQAASMIHTVKQSLLDDEENSHKFVQTDMNPERSSLSTTITRLDNEKSHIENDMDEQTRASSDFHRDLLNNMDFIEDSHQNSFDKQSPKEIHHKSKNEKPELHERVNVPHIQPDTDHLKNMMQLSDNSQDHSNQRTQLKMATMFNNEQPNLNVQFNSPQTFEEHTNIQQLMPFKEAEEIHAGNLHKLDFDTMHRKGEISSDVHDPLQTRWAHENHLQKIKGASQFHQDNMEMDGSSSHFSIDRSMPLSSIDGHHIGLNEQRWLQEKNVNAYKTATANTGLTLHNIQRNENSQLTSGMRKSTNNFEQLHDHGNLNIINGMSKMNTAMQQNNLMRGVPTRKMALEYADPNQWTHNHGEFRSSYGPASYGASSYGSSSYGSGGASASGGSTIGLFPNANVGNCAVPLLLSCSPSVISGSLAKSNAYSVPSYRSEDVNFHKKRDTDKTPGLKVYKTAPFVHQSTIILDKKH